MKTLRENEVNLRRAEARGRGTHQVSEGEGR